MIKVDGIEDLLVRIETLSSRSVVADHLQGRARLQGSEETLDWLQFNEEMYLACVNELVQAFNTRDHDDSGTAFPDLTDVTEDLHEVLVVQHDEQYYSNIVKSL